MRRRRRRFSRGRRRFGRSRRFSSRRGRKKRGLRLRIGYRM